jgi:radical SAM protein with 4Fe4S-binding SPASM domain
LGVDGINFEKMMGEEQSRVANLPPLTEEQVPKSKIAVYACEVSESYPCDATRGCYVTFDGKVLPCGLMAESVPRANYSQVQVGNLNSDTISAVRRSNGFVQLRKNIESGKYLPECRTCGGYKKTARKTDSKNHFSR